MTNAPSSDEALIQAAARFRTEGKRISALHACVIANSWHGGQGTAMYALASSGAVEPGLETELMDARVDARGMPAVETLALNALLDYVEHRRELGMTEVQDYWDQLHW